MIGHQILIQTLPGERLGTSRHRRWEHILSGSSRSVQALFRPNLKPCTRAKHWPPDPDPGPPPPDLSSDCWQLFA